MGNRRHNPKPRKLCYLNPANYVIAGNSIRDKDARGLMHELGICLHLPPNDESERHGQQALGDEVDSSRKKLGEEGIWSSGRAGRAGASNITGLDLSGNEVGPLLYLLFPEAQLMHPNLMPVCMCSSGVYVCVHLVYMCMFI